MDLLRKKRKDEEGEEELVKTEEASNEDGGRAEAKEEVKESSDVNEDLDVQDGEGEEE